MNAPDGQQAARGSARLFVALPVPETVRRTLERAQASFRTRAPDLRHTRPEGWHVTLAFLGAVERDRIDEVVRVVRAVVGSAAAGGAADLAIGGPGRFGRRVLWVAVDDDPPGALAELGESIQVAITRAGLPVQRQPVRPHLTLARGGRGRPVLDRYLDDLAAALEGGGDGDSGGSTNARWVADEVQLWRSELGRGPARYHVVGRVPLAP